MKTTYWIWRPDVGETLQTARHLKYWIETTTGGETIRFPEERRIWVDWVLRVDDLA